MNYCVLGAGAWGTAMTIHIARCGQAVTLMPRRMEHALEMSSARENADYLPGFSLDHNIQIGCQLRPVIMEAEVLVLACPVKGLRDLCEQIRRERSVAWSLKCIIVLCKGLEPETLLRPLEIVSEILPNMPAAVLSGPSFATEVAEGKPTAITLATDTDNASRARIQEELSSPALRIYLSSDKVGVELGACLKNIYAIGAGIADGLKLGYNAKAAYMTRALREMMDLGRALGGDAMTFFGLSGFGDLVATCNGSISRNRTFGEKIGAGQSPFSLMENRKTVVEGYWATQSFYELAKREGLEAPILSELHAVLYENKNPKEGIQTLMMRALKEES